MTNTKKTNTTIAFTHTQSDMFDFVLTVIHHNIHNKTSFLMNSIRNEVKTYLGLPDDISLTDEQLLHLAEEKHESLIKSLVGEENYNLFLDPKKVMIKPSEGDVE